MYHIFLIHSSIEKHLGCFKVLTMTNNVAMNIVEHMSLWYDWASFGYILKSGTAGSWGKLFPNFLRNCHSDIQGAVAACAPSRNTVVLMYHGRDAMQWKSEVTEALYSGNRERWLSMLSILLQMPRAYRGNSQSFQVDNINHHCS